jgi:hypothetical protein
MKNIIKLTQPRVDNLPIPNADETQVIVWDTDIKGFGVRISAGGSKAYIYQYRFKGKTKKNTIGKNGVWTCAQARIEAKEQQTNVARGLDAVEEKLKTGATFGDLMNAYVQVLENKGAKSAKAVKNQISKDLENNHPPLWKTPAKAITTDDVMNMINPLVVADKLRQADKLRAYIRTAYAEAINARYDVTAPASLKAMAVTNNPARDLRKIKGSSNAKTRALSIAEFQAYWQRVQALPEPARTTLMLHVLTGGQRQQQLARATRNDIDTDTQSLLLLDYKGRREQPRQHVIPLTDQAAKLVENLNGKYIFSSDVGRTPCHIDYINSYVKKICADMQKAKELEGEAFSAGVIRATIETRLIAKPYSVSSDVLAHLLSHGMGGVQQRHYQHHDFFDEKLEALQKLESMLEVA